MNTFTWNSFEPIFNKHSSLADDPSSVGNKEDVHDLRGEYTQVMVKWCIFNIHGNTVDIRGSIRAECGAFVNHVKVYLRWNKTQNTARYSSEEKSLVPDDQPYSVAGAMDFIWCIFNDPPTLLYPRSSEAGLE